MIIEGSKSILLCNCCSLVAANGDDSGCEFYHAFMRRSDINSGNGRHNGHAEMLLQFIHPNFIPELVNAMDWSITFPDDNSEIGEDDPEAFAICDGCGILLLDSRMEVESTFGMRAGLTWYR